MKSAYLIVAVLYIKACRG